MIAIRVNGTAHRFPVDAVTVPVANNDNILVGADGVANCVNRVIDREATTVLAVMIAIDDTNDDWLATRTNGFGIQCVGTAAMDVVTDGDGLTCVKSHTIAIGTMGTVNHVWKVGNVRVLGVDIHMCLGDGDEGDVFG